MAISKLGRPKLPLDTHRIRELASLGLTMEQTADRLGCSRRHLFECAKQDPQVRQALDQGLAEGIERVASALFRAATEGGSVSAQIAWLRCRAGWVAKPATVPIAVVPSAAPPPVDVGHVAEMAAFQRSLVDADWDEDTE